MMMALNVGGYRRSYWTISGRMGALNTAGRGCVFPLALPSLPAMVTVGRVAIVGSQDVN